MDDSTLFYFGIFIMALFISGILFTVREFKAMEEQRGVAEKDRDKKIRRGRSE